MVCFFDMTEWNQTVKRFRNKLDQYSFMICQYIRWLKSINSRRISLLSQIHVIMRTLLADFYHCSNGKEKEIFTYISESHFKILDEDKMSKEPEIWKSSLVNLFNIFWSKFYFGFKLSIDCLTNQMLFVCFIFLNLFVEKNSVLFSKSNTRYHYKLEMRPEFDYLKQLFVKKKNNNKNGQIYLICGSSCLKIHSLFWMFNKGVIKGIV